MIFLDVPDKWLIEVIPRDTVHPWCIDQIFWGVTNDATRLIRRAGGWVIGDGEVSEPHKLSIVFANEADAALFKLTHL